MPTLTVLIIRHAEKPVPEAPESGLTAAGEPDKRSLVIRGWQRAGAWAARFGSAADADYPAPLAIYAVDPERPVLGKPDHLPSRRPLQTIRPLADRLGLVPTLWVQGDEARLATEVAARSGVVLISWEHKLIGATLLPALLGGQRPAGVPAMWDSSRFDVVLRLDRAGGSWSARQIFPRLLAGDSDTPMQ